MEQCPLQHCGRRGGPARLGGAAGGAEERMGGARPVRSHRGE
ncbi:hypothetical protein [uncultured Bacteroides sp.]|nr:hypothetical protein [uncultured Bacteroides sp.]